MKRYATNIRYHNGEHPYCSMEETENGIWVFYDAVKQARLDGMKEAVEIVVKNIRSPQLSKRVTEAIKAAMEVDNES